MTVSAALTETLHRAYRQRDRRSPIVVHGCFEVIVIIGDASKPHITLSPLAGHHHSRVGTGLVDGTHVAATVFRPKAVSSSVVRLRPSGVTRGVTAPASTFVVRGGVGAPPDPEARASSPINPRVTVIAPAKK